jgi:hypothetical protein
MPNTLMRATRPGDILDLGDANTAPFPVRSKESFIQWPTEREIWGVSEQLARIQRAGIRSEANGEYFKSGDLAYQMQEIIRATADLAKKSARTKE